MTLVKCRASPEGTTTERSVYPLQGVQTQSAGVKEVFRRKTCEGIQKFAFDTLEAQQYMRQAQRRRKQQHLNSAKMRVQAYNMLTTNALQGFRRQYQRFRCSVGVKCRKMQICPAGISGKGFTERQRKPPHASEPEPKPQKPPQLIETLPIAEIHQETLCVQMHRKTIASELCENADSVPNTLTISVLKEFQRQYQRFRCSVGMKHP